MKNNRLKTMHFCKLMAALGAVVLMIIMLTQKAAAAEKKDYPYLIRINRYHNTITVYAKDEKGSFCVPVKAFICSTGQKGTQTALGTFQTKAKYRWKALMGDVWGQYSTRIVGGILFHSVYYYEYKNPGTLAINEYNKLGSPASHGCIRMTVGDAKWIYDNCPVGTTVNIYDDSNSPGPLGKPETIKLPKSIRWDPTDPSSNNPYNDKKPKLLGIKKKSVPWGTEIDLLEGITAKSTVGADITKKISVEGRVDINIPGTYKITYSVTDALGRTALKTTGVTVKDPPEPVFTGVKDHIVPWNVEITRDYVLEGVTAVVGEKPVDREDIAVTIEYSDDTYLVSYSVSIGKAYYGQTDACYITDGEAPAFSGISDRTLAPSQIPDTQYALYGITVTDNCAVLTIEDVAVTIREVPWKAESPDRKDEEAVEADYAFLVTYEVSDDVGNARIMSAVFHY